MKSNLTCFSHVRAYALEYAKFNRAKGFNRVSASFLEAIERMVKTAVESRVQHHPSKGKTLK